MLSMRLLWRDWRGGELGVLLASLVIAVTIVTGISLFTERLQQALVQQSHQFLAADKVLESPNAVPEAWLTEATKRQLRQAQVVEFQSMIYADDEMLLASVKAVSASYPLLGQLEISDQTSSVAYTVTHGPSLGEIWLAPRVLKQLQISLGDQIYVGEAALRVTALLVKEPDNAGSGFSLGPRVMIHTDDLAATDVVKPGSRVQYRYLFAGEPLVLAGYEKHLSGQLLPSHRWRGLDESQPRISQSLARAERFLLLAGALGVGLAGIAIALAARRYSERHYDAVALMKSMGATGSRILQLYSLKLLVLALAAIILGSLLGLLVQQGFIFILRDYIDVAEKLSFPLRPFLLGALTAVVCLMAFAMPAIINLQAIEPLRVLRRDLAGHEVAAGVSYSVGTLAIALLMYVYSNDWRLTLSVLAGVLLVVVVGGGIAYAVLRSTQQLSSHSGTSMGLALAAMRRRGKQNTAHTVIFSLAIMLLLVLGLLRTSLVAEWQRQLPPETPNLFLINIGAEQLVDVAELLNGYQLTPQPSYPMVRGRLTHINQQPVTQRVSKDEPGANSIDRELNLSWANEIPVGNELVAGQWWQVGSERQEVSVEASLAEKLQLSIGDQLVFQLGSQQLNVEISSIRQLDWESMRPNFYMIFPPRLLNSFPATYINSFYLPADKTTLLNDLLSRFPTISVIDMEAIISQIQSIMQQASEAIALVLGLVVISGILVLIASVQASVDQRIQESAIMRALGASRRLVLGSLVIEFMSLGVLAGLLAAGAAELSVMLIQQHVLGMTAVAHPWVWLLGPIVGGLLIGGAGYMTCRRVVNAPPLIALNAA